MFTVLPHDQQRQKVRGTVELFYVGIEYDRAHKGFPPPVQIKTLDAVQMPRLGESIVFDEVWSEDLIFKTRYKDSSGVLRDSFVPASKGGAEMARFIRKAIEEGKSLDPKEIQREATKAQAAQLLPDEDLVDLLKQRGIEAPPELLERILARQEDIEKSRSMVDPKDIVVDLRSDREKQAASLNRNNRGKNKESK